MNWIYSQFERGGTFYNRLFKKYHLRRWIYIFLFLSNFRTNGPLFKNGIYHINRMGLEIFKYTHTFQNLVGVRKKKTEQRNCQHWNSNSNSNYKWRVAIVLNRWTHKQRQWIGSISKHVTIFLSVCLWLLAFARYISNFIVSHCMAWHEERKKTHDPLALHVTIHTWYACLVGLRLWNVLKHGLKLQRYCCSCAICR